VKFSETLADFYKSTQQTSLQHFLSNYVQIQGYNINSSELFLPKLDIDIVRSSYAAEHLLFSCLLGVYRGTTCASVFKKQIQEGKV